MTDDDTDAGLPRAARDRMAEIRSTGTWGSTLSTGEFAAIRGVGSGAVVPAESLTVLSLDHQRKQATRARPR